MEIKIIKKPNSYKAGGEINIKKSHEGLFTQKANRAGMGVQEFASHVLANRQNYSSDTIKQAVFAQNTAKWHAQGGFLNNLGFFDERGIAEDYSSNAGPKTQTFLQGFGFSPNGSFNQNGEYASYESAQFNDKLQDTAVQMADAYKGASRRDQRAMRRASGLSKKDFGALMLGNTTPLFAEGGNLLAEGGTILGGYHTNGADWQQPGGFHIIGSGGTHEENKNEGVRQGTDQQGVPNLVEQNEVVYNNYVFSARLTVPERRQGKDKELSDLAWEEKMLKPYEGMTYAEAAQKAYKEVQERPNDPIAKRGFETILGVLANSQEKERAKKEHQDAADQINEMSGQEFAQAKAAEEQQQAIEQAMQEQAVQQQMQEQQMQEQQMQEQQMQEPSPEEVAMMQQQQAMQQAGQAEVAALGGNIHAYGGNFYDNGGQLDLQRYQQIFQQIAAYANANKEEQPELYNAVTQVKTPQQMLEFVSQYLAAQEEQRQQVQQQTQQPTQTNQFATGGSVDNDKESKDDFEEWWGKIIEHDDVDYGKVYDKILGTSYADVINNNPLASSIVKEALREAYKKAKAENHLNAFSNFKYEDNVSSEPTPEPTAKIEVRQLTDREKEKAQRQLNRYYRKRGIDPSRLSGVAAKKYQQDLQEVYSGLQTDEKYDFSKDTTLAINNSTFNKNTKKANLITYKNNALYDDYISRGAKDVEVSKDGKVKWNPITGITIVDNTTDNFYSTPANFTEANGIYDYNDGTKGYTSQNFSTSEELQQYYKDAITQRFKTLKGNKYEDASLPKYHLNASELRSWVNDLQNSDDPKAKELALALKANWGDANTPWGKDATWNLKNRFNKNGTVTESQSYLNLDAVKKNPLQTDALPGIKHVPYLEAIQTNPIANRYFYTDTKGQQHFITKPEEGSGFTISKTPRTAKVGDITYNDYEVTGFGRERKLYQTPDGRVLDVTDVTGEKWKPTDAIMQDDTSNLGEGVIGTSSWVNPSEEGGDGVDFILPSNWPWLTGLGSQAGVTAYNAIKPIDYSNADAVISATKEAGKFQPISFRPNGDYLAYKPFDTDYEGTKIRSAMAAERRLLANLSGGNRGTAAANIIASDNNLITKLGDGDRKSAEYNRNDEIKRAEFNRGTSQFNSEGFLKADMANQDAISKASQAQLEGLVKGYAMRQAAEEAKANAINAGLSGIAENLFGLYQQDVNNAFIRYGMDTNTYGTANYDWKKNQTAQGGQLRTRRRRGLTF